MSLYHTFRVFKKYLKDKEYHVKDTIPKNMEVLFILESPHNEEIKQKLPLCGPTGELVTNFFKIKSQKPFGELVSDNMNKGSARIGIMNVSKVPLQITEKLKSDKRYNNDKEKRKARKQGKSQSKTMATISLLDFLRKNSLSAFEGCPSLDMFKERILNDFEKRLKKLDYKNLTVILCGAFAQESFNYSKNRYRGIQDKFANEIHVDHPSYGNWSKHYSNSKLRKCKLLMNIVSNY